jgi:hypothetical protein
MKQVITKEKSLEINQYLQQYFNDYIIIANIDNKKFFTFGDGDPEIVGQNIAHTFIHEIQNKSKNFNSYAINLAYDLINLHFAEQNTKINKN